MIMQQQVQELVCSLPFRHHTTNLYEEEVEASAAVAPAQKMLQSYNKSTIVHTHIIPQCAHTHNLVPQYTHTYPNSLPSNVHDFTPLGTLGRGNMGTVILVVSKQSPSPCPFALKITHSLASKKQRSHVERDILYSLHHPFLQTLHAHFESGLHSSLLLLDFCSGGDLNLLRHRQPEKRFSETAARFYAAEVVVALEYLHKLGIVYRDLKPENILVQGSGHIKLTDFDLSLKIEAGRPAEAVEATARAPSAVSSAARAPVCSLKQQLAADTDTDFVPGNQSLHYGCFAGLRKCRNRRRESAVEGDLGLKSVQREGCLYGGTGEGEEGCLSRRKRGGGQRFSCGMMYVCGTTRAGEGCLSRRKQGAKEGCFRRRRKSHTGEIEAARGRSVCVVGTDEYVAPEVLRGEEHSFSMDWWSFGVFLYEMIYGSTPFKGASSEETLCNILERKPEFPGMQTPAKHLIAQLLVKDPAARLGAKGAHDIKRHPFFSDLHWDSLPHISRPPFIPPPLCLSELEEKYSAKVKAKREPQNIEQKLSNTRKSWLDELVESMEAAENEHQSSHCSRSSSSAGFMSSSVDGTDRELHRDDDVDAIFSSAEWSSELDVCVQPPS
eukprot:c24613_g1_i1 orf=133-1959(-)